MKRAHAASTRLALSICAVLVGVWPAIAEVVWDATKKSAQFPQGADQAVVVFRGTAGNPKPVAIVSASPTCDCATASIDTAQATGERACVVRVILTRSAKHPNPASAVKVTTSDGANHLLTIDREGSPHVKVVPALVWWNENAAVEKREFIVQADPTTLPILKLSAEPTSANFTCDKERLDSHRWRVSVKPLTTAKAETAAIRCEVTRSANSSTEGACRVSAHLKIVAQ